MLLEQVRPAHQDLAALGGAHRAPRAFEGAAGGRDGVVDIGLVAFGDDSNDLAGRGIERFEGATRARRYAPAIDEQVLGPGHELGGGEARKVICN